MKTKRKAFKMGPSITIPKKQEILTRRDVKKMIEKQVAVDSEAKFVRVQQSAVSVSSTAGVFDMSNVIQGDAPTSRIGNQITPSYILFRYQVVVSDPSNLVRVVLFQWKSDTVPTYNDIFDDGSGGTGIIYHGGLEYYKVSTKDLRYVIYDKVHNLNENQTTHYRDVKINLKLIKSNRYIKKIEYQANASATPATGKIYLLLVSDSGVSTHPAIIYSYQMYYHDM